MNEQDNYGQLLKELYSKLNRLQGEFVAKRAGYEQELAKRLGRGWTWVDHIAFDLKFKQFQVEVKKAQNGVWLNKLRYIERHKGNNVTLVLFHKPHTNQIYDFSLIPTHKLRAKLFENYPHDFDLSILRNLENWAPRQLNMQENLTKKDLLELSVC